MHRLTSHFILGYHGCRSSIGEDILAGKPFKQSNNNYDWLGSGIYFWESDPKRALEFCKEKRQRDNSKASTKWLDDDKPFVVGAIIDPRLCLDFTTTVPTDLLDTYSVYKELADTSGLEMPKNSSNGLLKPLDCAVINMLHDVRMRQGFEPIDSLKGAYIEGCLLYTSPSPRDS